MANPEAIARMAGGPKPPMGGAPGGPPAGAPPEPPPAAPGPESGGGGIETMVEDLSKVGEFLKAQQAQGNPKAQEVMGTFQTLIKGLAELGGDASPDVAMPSGEPGGSGRVHESMKPGVQVL